jgi:hypothetical protein
VKENHERAGQRPRKENAASAQVDTRTGSWHGSPGQQGSVGALPGTVLARNGGMNVIMFALAAILIAQPLAAQVVPPPAKSDRDAVQHGAQPNPDEVRPGTRDGDAPSAAAGDLVAKPARRILGLPLTTVLLVGGVLVALLVVAGFVIPGANRRRRAQGGGTYDRP